jgi:hypothetical protein
MMIIAPCVSCSSYSSVSAPLPEPPPPYIGEGGSGGDGGGGGLTQAQADLLYVKLIGDTMTGALTIPTPPTVAGHAASKAYVDSMISSVDVAHLANATEYTLSLAPTAPPLQGEVRLNNTGNQSLASTLWIHHVNAVGEDCANIFRVLDSSSKIFIQDLDNSTAYQIYRLSGNPVDNVAGKYITMSLQWLSGGAPVPTGGRCFIGL